MTLPVLGFYMPTENLIGVGAVKQAGEKLKNLGVKKVLIVCDAGLFKFGVADMVAGYVREAGVEAVIFPGAEPNPTDKNVEAGLEVYNKEKCDGVISLGGGSSHDCTKGIAIVASNGGRIHDYEGVDISKKPSLPHVAINTTSGTGSEMTRFCIITDTSRHVKMAIVDTNVTPTISINDPELTVKKPPALTAATGMDALTHAVEAYVSTIATPITDACALQAIRLIAKSLRAAVANGEDIQAREDMSYAEFLAGMAFNGASLGYVHGVAHQFGGFYNLPHGVCNAILLPYISRFNLNAKMERFVDIAVALGENVSGLSTRAAAELAIEAIVQMSHDVGITQNFTDLGAKIEDIPTLVENAQKDACSFTNPRKATNAELAEVIRAAF
jgi:alcohol dehydrogenase